MTVAPEYFSPLERVIDRVRVMVSMFRRHGVVKGNTWRPNGVDKAIPEIANFLEISPKRVKSLFYRDGLWAVLKSEADKIEAKFVLYLDREIALSIEYTEQLKLTKRQLSLGLEECNVENSQSPGYGFESTDLLLRSVG